jgi:hypothetical protein
VDLGCGWGQHPIIKLSKALGCENNPSRHSKAVKRLERWNSVWNEAAPEAQTGLQSVGGLSLFPKRWYNLRSMVEMIDVY